MENQQVVSKKKKIKMSSFKMVDQNKMVKKELGNLEECVAEVNTEQEVSIRQEVDHLEALVKSDLKTDL